MSNNDLGITAVQKLLTFGMLAFMGYLFFSQDQENKIILPQQPATISSKTQVTNITITNTKTGEVKQSDLAAGEIILGKWKIELTKEEQKKPQEPAPKKTKSQEKPAAEQAQPAPKLPKS